MEVDPARVYIAAMPRSGSTLLANLLTAPPWRLVFVEPWLVAGGNNDLLSQCRRLGWDITDDEAALRPGEDSAARWLRILTERLATVDAWGVKEIFHLLHKPTIELIQPRTILILVRDMREIVLSNIELAVRRNSLGTPQEVRRDLLAAGSALVELAGMSPERTIVVRYEDFVASSACRSQVQRRLAWGFGGEFYRDFEVSERSYEKARRGAALTSTVADDQRTLPEGAIRIAEEIAEEASEYRAAFGY